MKKLLPYIFILIVLVGTLGGVIKVRAADGTCSDGRSTSYAECHDYNGGTWTPNQTQTQNNGVMPPFCPLGSSPKLQNLLSYATCIISRSVIPLIFALAVVMFIWGVVQYVINSDEEVKKEKGRQFMTWGIIALTVMICVWGLVAILGNTFGINTTFIPQVRSPSQ